MSGNEEEILNSLQESDDSEPDFHTLLSRSLLELTEILETVRALALNEKIKLVEEGWDQENAEMVAMSVYGTLLSTLAGIK